MVLIGDVATSKKLFVRWDDMRGARGRTAWTLTEQCGVSRQRQLLLGTA